MRVSKGFSAPYPKNATCKDILENAPLTSFGVLQGFSSPKEEQPEHPCKGWFASLEPLIIALVNILVIYFWWDLNFNWIIQSKFAPYKIFIMIWTTFLVFQTLSTYHVAIHSHPGKIPLAWRKWDGNRTTMPKLPAWSRPKGHLREYYMKICTTPEQAESKQTTHHDGRTICKIVWCDRCSAFRPPRSKHCRTCDICVSRFDHHCNFLNNCVGLDNHRYFLQFCFWIAFTCFHYVALVAADSESWFCVLGTVPFTAIFGFAVLLFAWLDIPVLSLSHCKYFFRLFGPVMGVILPMRVGLPNYCRQRKNVMTYHRKMKNQHLEYTPSNQLSMILGHTWLQWLLFYIPYDRKKTLPKYNGREP